MGVATVCKKIFGWFLITILVGIIGSCSYIAYGMWEPYLDDIYYPMPLKADGSQFEFEYRPGWAILRRQTLALGMKASDFYEHVQGSGLGVKLKLEIYQGGEKQYENVFLFRGCNGKYTEKPQGVQKPFSMMYCTGDSLMKKIDAYGTSFFKFQPYKTYRIVVTDLENENPQLSRIPIFVGLMGAYAFRTVKFADFRF